MTGLMITHIARRPFAGVFLLLVGMLGVGMLGVGTPAFAQEDGARRHTLAATADTERPRASLQDVAWMVGHWRGEALGGISEEIWAPPLGGSMMGVYKLVRDGEIVFYEIMVLAEEEGTLVLRLKHFDPGLIGWEEREEVVEFPLVRLGSEEAFYDGMTFRRLGPDTLEAYVAIGNGDGGLREERFLYRRVMDGLP